jgi:hypothetical protein
VQFNDPQLEERVGRVHRSPGRVDDPVARPLDLSVSSASGTPPAAADLVAPLNETRVSPTLQVGATAASP